MDEQALIAIEGGTRLDPELGGHIVEDAAERKRRIVTELKGLLEGKQFAFNQPYPIIGNTLKVCICTTTWNTTTVVVMQIGHIGRGNSSDFEDIEIAMSLEGQDDDWDLLDDSGRIHWPITQSPQTITFKVDNLSIC